MDSDSDLGMFTAATEGGGQIDKEVSKQANEWYEAIVEELMSGKSDDKTVSIYVHVCTCMYVCMYVGMYVSVCVCVCMYVSKFEWYEATVDWPISGVVEEKIMCMCVWICAKAYANMCMCVYIYRKIHTCIHTYTHAYIRIHTQTFNFMHRRYSEMVSSSSLNSQVCMHACMYVCIICSEIVSSSFLNSEVCLHACMHACMYV